MNALLTVISIAARIVSRSEGYAFACPRAHLPVGTRHRKYTLRSPGVLRGKLKTVQCRPQRTPDARSRAQHSGESALIQSP